MKIALEELGYKNVYHMSTTAARISHPDLWIEAINAKFGPHPDLGALTSEFFDQILGEFDAVTDIPCACFAPELMAAYPKAKIILTQRSTSSWQASMLKTIHALQSSPTNRFFVYLSSIHIKKLSHLMDLIITHYFHNSIPLYGAQCYEDHNETVKKVARAAGREVLQFQLGDGWESLCTFLQKDIPPTNFPHVNERENWRKSFGLGWTLRKVFIFGLVPIIALSGLWALLLNA